MSGDRITAELERARAAGERLALAEIVDGPGVGSRLLVWPGGQALGSLGSPRLNQRVALYAEGLITRGGTARKRFDTPEGDVELLTAVHPEVASD